MRFRSLVMGLVALVATIRAVPARAAGRPKLVVLLVVDQMRADYVDRFQGQWKKGWKRLLDRGAWYTHAAYPYLDTVTCPGHATIGTGTFPRTHGMVLNGWFDRASGKVLPCTDDPRSPLIGHGFQATGGDSARNLLVPTLADEMRAQLSPAPRVVAMSMKARGAITLAGHRADAALWFANGVVTSKSYGEQPLRWVNDFLARSPVQAALARPWTRALPESAYLYADEAAEELPPSGWTRTFPHALDVRPGDTALWEASPAADHFLGELGKAALAAVGLGRGGGTDFLSISFSALDRVGHAFGPRSHEIQDVMIRLDETLGDLFTELDRRVGADKWVVALTADHGVAAYPEQMTALGLDAGRIVMSALTERLNDALAKALGPGRHLASMQYTNVYLAPGVREKLAAKPDALKAVLETVRSTPGVAGAYFADDLAAGPDGRDPNRDAAAFTYHAGRSGDIMLVPRPHFLTVPSGTTHGTANDYDQRVPIFLMGAGIKPGVYRRAVTPADIVPTLGATIGVTLPKASGTVLFEALK